MGAVAVEAKRDIQLSINLRSEFVASINALPKRLRNELIEGASPPGAGPTSRHPRADWGRAARSAHHQGSARNLMRPGSATEK
jgi:hypothetical protein